MYCIVNNDVDFVEVCVYFLKGVREKCVRYSKEDNIYEVKNTEQYGI